MVFYLKSRPALQVGDFVYLFVNTDTDQSTAYSVSHQQVPKLAKQVQLLHSNCCILSANLGYAMVWIMSQRILIHLRGALSFSPHCRQPSEINPELAAESNNPVSRGALTRNVLSSKDIAKGVRSQSDSRAPITTTTEDVELALQVHVERIRTVEYDSLDDDKDHKKANTSGIFGLD